MVIHFLYVLNALLLLSGFLVIYLKSNDRRFSLSLIQTLLALPLLAGEYLYLFYHQEIQTLHVVLFSEIVFTLAWLSMAQRLRNTTITSMRESRLNLLVEITISTIVTAMTGYFLIFHPMAENFETTLNFEIYSSVYFSTIFILMTFLYTAWRLEQFWRTLNTAMHWEYKFLMVGGYLVCGTMIWSASYRLTYLTIIPKHLLLIAVLLFFGWTLMTYAVIHHRLLNRKIFVSRKVVYSFVVPSLLAAYLLVFGIISLIMRTFGLKLSFLLTWLFFALGFIAAGIFAFSGKMRRRAHFYISTHFYINKYEYRDEWLSLSQHLHGALTEADVIKALRHVLSASLYTADIFIWIGDFSKGYRLISSPANHNSQVMKNTIVSNDNLVLFFENHSYFHVKEKEPGPDWQKVAKSNETLLASLNLILLSPISIGDQLVGIIGLGPEFTSGQYGHDDFDLLAVLGSQTASALLAVRMAEELAHTREQQAWNRLSAFVLHDIKNAATMLSLLQENAPEHIHKPEFQQDMLELVDDALRRMGRVEQRLQTLKDKIKPTFRNFELGHFLKDCSRKLQTKLVSMEIIVKCKNKIQIRTDPELLFSILENLLLNAFEAQEDGLGVQIHTYSDSNGQAVIEVLDSGPGIAEKLLPDALFEPFKTTKDGGSGIGLWQVQKVTTSLGGSISAKNNKTGGARFVIRLPLPAGVG